MGLDEYFLSIVSFNKSIDKISIYLRLPFWGFWFGCYADWSTIEGKGNDNEFNVPSQNPIREQTVGFTHPSSCWPWSEPWAQQCLQQWVGAVHVGMVQQLFFFESTMTNRCQNCFCSNYDGNIRKQCQNSSDSLIHGSSWVPSFDNVKGCPTIVKFHPGTNIWFDSIYIILFCSILFYRGYSML